MLLVACLRKTSDARGHMPMFLPRAHPLDVIADTAISRVSLTSDNRVMVAAMLLLPAFSLAKVLVKYCHKDGPFVSKLERGVLTSVTTETLEQFAGVLACSTDYLLGRTDDPRPKPPAQRQWKPTAASVG